jgi:anthranilate phosphoribosyltransferase
MSLTQAIALAADRREVPAATLEAAFDTIARGEATPVQIAALLVALRTKGETVRELAAVARALRKHADTAPLGDARTVDTCGTGGDGAGTLNVSTAVAFIVAGAGVPVAKHGNRAASSRSGSSDVLAALGVNLEAGPELTARAIRESGVGFMFAAYHHKAVARVAAVRRKLGVRTIFNALGPLCNPAGAKAQLMGVYDRKLCAPLAEALGRLGSHTAWVVAGGDGLDELTTTDVSYVSALAGGDVRSFIVAPEDAGLARAAPADLKGGDPAENAAALRALLDSKKGPYRDIALLNAAAALIVGGKAVTLKEGAALAARSIDEGRARLALDRLVAISNGRSL